MNHEAKMERDAVAEVLNASGASKIVLACEHASCFIPASLNGLGLTGDALTSHAAWDPGAKAVAQHMAARLDAPLVASCVSRLVYDCNRPPGAAGAMPARSEIYDIPGNAGLTDQARKDREDVYYTPFRSALAETIARRRHAVLVTIHSFTPVYQGVARDVEIGILHDADTRLADAMLAAVPPDGPYLVQRNQPYGPADGVTHTLKEHALPRGLLNVMIEIRNDLIRAPTAQEAMAQHLGDWISTALAAMKDAQCKA